MNDVYIAFGSNTGNRRQYINRALKLLNTHPCKLIKTSRILETDPESSLKHQQNFLNGVCQIQTDASPFQLLAVLQHIEKILNRERIIINGPRTIDLDILLYGDYHIVTKTLTIPHPRMLNRDFVMIPLKEIAPHKVRQVTV
ncbi:MAG: 2-amino-4-hydroxy-6-hydroxymethyldihydropteridine diphosphokinase [Candidatus Omnitrophica bacterium]|nr:2-amino-4-hydroxy-6-hydroxymethyldihydropteridine diphosphokinase [Candidatus Omnitrophota bacterium]